MPSLLKIAQFFLPRVLTHAVLKNKQNNGNVPNIYVTPPAWGDYPTPYYDPYATPDLFEGMPPQPGCILRTITFVMQEERVDIGLHSSIPTARGRRSWHRRSSTIESAKPSVQYMLIVKTVTFELREDRTSNHCVQPGYKTFISADPNVFAGL